MSKILFLGCGKMGSAIIKGLIKSHFDPEKISVIDPNFNAEIHGINEYSNQSQLPEQYKADYIFLCIKPQDSQEILEKFAKADIFDKKTVIISILSGKKIKFFQDIFTKKAKIIRVMPNIAIAQNQGVSAYLFSRNIKEKEREPALSLLKCFGENIELKNEKQFDDFTAIFGSGPGYLFYLQEIFLKFAKTLEIDEEKAAKLVEKLFLGSSLMSQNSNDSFLELKNSVASKGGTTQEALDILQKNDALEKLFAKAIKKASKRSKELSK